MYRLLSAFSKCTVLFHTILILNLTIFVFVMSSLRDSKYTVECALFVYAVLIYHKLTAVIISLDEYCGCSQY
jgi:hypothetical protein